MTYRELVQKEIPEWVSDEYMGGVMGCPRYFVDNAQEICEKGCRRSGNEDKCARCWDQEMSDQTGKRANAGKGGTMIALKLDRADIENLIEFFDLSFFDHLKKLLDADALDNMEYLASMLRVYDELAQGAERGGDMTQEFNRDPMEAMKES